MFCFHKYVYFLQKQTFHIKDKKHTLIKHRSHSEHHRSNASSAVLLVDKVLKYIFEHKLVELVKFFCVSSSSSFLLCPFSAERKPLPRASPNSPRLHRPDHLRPRRRAAPAPVCPHVHGDPHGPPAARLHHGPAALTHGHSVARLPPGPPGGQTAGGRPPPHALTGRGSRC